MILQILSIFGNENERLEVKPLIPQLINLAGWQNLRFMKGMFLSLLLFMMVSCSMHHSPLTTEFPDAKLKDIYTLDIYRDMEKIHILLSGVDQASNEIALKYLFSEDAGESWSEAVTVNNGLSAVKKSRRGNDFQIAASGDHLMTVWQAEGSVPWAGVLVVAESSDRGKTWRKIASPVSKEYAMIDQGYFDLSADVLGNFHIVWLDDREENGNFQVLRYAKLSAGSAASGWQAYQQLDASVCTCCWTAIDTDNMAGVHVLFRDDVPRDMALISSGDRGSSWRKSNPVSAFNWEFVGCPHQGGNMAIAQQGGNVVIHSVIWNGSQSGPGLYYSHSLSSNMNNWKPVIPVKGETSFSGDIALIDDRKVAMVYGVGIAEQKRIEAIQSFDGGQSWSEAKILSRKGVLPSHPRLIGIEQGYRAFWTEQHQDGHSIWKMAEL
jgi:hypothetical protein